MPRGGRRPGAGRPRKRHVVRVEVSAEDYRVLELHAGRGQVAVYLGELARGAATRLRARYGPELGPEIKEIQSDETSGAGKGVVAPGAKGGAGGG